ncbi:MAG: hypothetical protein P8099_06135 [Gemmatimonadota bacterium]|jgi:hypothetical protein
MSDEESVSTLRFIRIAGIVAALLAVANGIGDIFYQAVPDGAYDASGEFMWRISEPHLRFGAYIGLFAIALIWVGYWHVYHGIRKAGHWLALPPIIIAMCTVGIGCAFHFGLLYPALLGHQIIASSGDAAQVLRPLYASMDHATVTVAIVYQVGVAVFSLWLMVLIFMGRTHYPRWFGIMNPMFLTIAWYLVVPLIPRYGTYLDPAAALSDALFFAVSTKLLWNVET